MEIIYTHKIPGKKGEKRWLRKQNDKYVKFIFYTYSLKKKII